MSVDRVASASAAERDPAEHAAELAGELAPERPSKPAIAAAAPLGEPGDPRGKRIAGAAKDALDASVSRLGSSIGSIGEGVSRLGEMSRIPMVGSGVARLGEGIAHVGESLHALPQAARTRRGRLLIRSSMVGFVLVAAWIIVIVALQLHGNDAPDFRPNAERVLAQLSSGAIAEVYEQASPRFQEVVRKERFSDDMTDLAQTVGKFREITSVNDSLVTTGPTGRVGRVALTVAYEKALCQVSVSLPGETTSTTVGQIELAIFVNKSGLQAIGDNLFLETPASGAPQNGTPSTDGFGDLQQGNLEQANVEAVKEISDLIAAQRAYEMNAKIITATDQMLQSTSQMLR